ncbi:hypothetical protein SETIT_1G233100v2 [Setaria italica]|uniref:Leucine-rich repeat-containing N-terminal plant-type domain-containing protein n=2 Tax=Setaria italica TaxID=4555 RepID=A0A368PP82_SETIT|nr:hypothetical protein SETIT_1G233100v2 [Setaria italica]
MDLACNVVHCSAVHGNSTDLLWLLHFKNGVTNDPFGALSNWNTSTHFCWWSGIKCSPTRPWRVTKLNLTGQSLCGQMSSSLGNMIFVDLSNNSFTGTVPLLNKLQYLNSLFLGSNLLQGVIPTRIGFLTKLQGLSFQRNSLSGVIPPGLGNITDLSVIVLSENQLNGPIPSEFWRMPNIASLYMFENNLSGGIPRTLSNLSSLGQLSLEGNMLGNTLPSNFGNALPSNASGLIDWDLSSNKFTGQIPSIFGSLSGLSILNLEENMLEASDRAIPPSLISNLTQLTTMSFAENKLTGFIPPGLGNLKHMTSLNLSYNNFQGSIPVKFGNLKQPISLHVSSNKLSGVIPETLGQCQQLTTIQMDQNILTGNTSRPPSLWEGLRRWRGEGRRRWGKGKQRRRGEGRRRWGEWHRVVPAVLAAAGLAAEPDGAICEALPVVGPARVTASAVVHRIAGAAVAVNHPSVL